MNETRTADTANDLRCLHAHSEAAWFIQVAKRAADEIERLQRELAAARKELTGMQPMSLDELRAYATDETAAYAEELREALESARDGLINLRPDRGPMHQQMTKHIIAMDAALAAKPQGESAEGTENG